MKNKKGFRKFFIVLHCLLVFVFLLVALTPFINPHKLWFISILGMGYPILLLAVLVALVICAVLRSKWIILPLIALVISYKQISSVFAFRLPEEFNMTKDENSLRILSWNVSRWTENKHSMGNRPENSYRNRMMEEVMMQNADVLCFQEFFQCYTPSLFPDNIEPIKKMGYPYYYFSPSSITVSGEFQTGLAIFSRFPITDSSFNKTINGGHSEGFSYIDINFRGRPVRIFNTHLESPGLTSHSYDNLSGQFGTSLFSRIKRSYYFRQQQAMELKNSMNNSPHPVVLCGDFGDVPNSYAYFKLKKGMQDVFLKEGSGLGRTFRFISPTIRIDYTLADNAFEVLQFENMKFEYSDHYPLITDLQFRK